MHQQLSVWALIVSMHAWSVRLCIFIFGEVWDFCHLRQVRGFCLLAASATRLQCAGWNPAGMGQIWNLGFQSLYCIHEFKSKFASVRFQLYFGENITIQSQTVTWKSWAVVVDEPLNLGQTHLDKLAPDRTSTYGWVCPSLLQGKMQSFESKPHQYFMKVSLRFEAPQLKGQGCWGAKGYGSHIANGFHPDLNLQSSARWNSWRACWNT